MSRPGVGFHHARTAPTRQCLGWVTIGGMSDASDYLENELIDHALGTGAFTAPTNVYVQLHTGAPGEAGTANVATENTRKLVTFGAASGGTATSNVALTWSSVAATETFSHFTIFDALTVGNCLVTAALTASKAVTAGDDFEIASGSLTVTLA